VVASRHTDGAATTSRGGPTRRSGIVPGIDEATRTEIRDLVVQFFADECDVEPDSITDETHIIEELEGDSLMLLSLLRKICTDYSITIELKTLGKHLMKKPANTIGDILTLTFALVEHGDGIVNVDL
jgi:acyl carrier protein